MKVSELMNPKGVLLYAKIDNSADALGILVELQEGIGVITNGNAYYNAVSYRGNVRRHNGHRGRYCAAPTPATRACPHGNLGAAAAPRCRLGAPGREPVDLVFMIAVPPGSESLHLQILARLVNLLSRSDLCGKPAHSQQPPPLCGADRQGGKRLLCGIKPKVVPAYLQAGAFVSSAGAFYMRSRNLR